MIRTSQHLRASAYFRGRRFHGIELRREFAEIARRRIDKAGDLELLDAGR